MIEYLPICKVCTECYRYHIEPAHLIPEPYHIIARENGGLNTACGLPVLRPNLEGEMVKVVDYCYCSNYIPICVDCDSVRTMMELAE